MNYSLYSADRTTHVKVVVVALIAAMLVVGIGIAARISEPDSTTPRRMEAQIPLIKAGGPVILTDSDSRLIR